MGSKKKANKKTEMMKLRSAHRKTKAFKNKKKYDRKSENAITVLFEKITGKKLYRINDED